MSFCFVIKRSAVVASLALLSGCCGSIECDACDPYVNGVALRFSTDTLQSTGFRRAEVRSAYVVRYANQDFTGARDTIRQAFGPRDSPRDFFRDGLELGALPAPAGTGTARPPFTQFSYRVVVPAASRQYEVSDLRLDGEQGTGCACACYRNTRRRFTLNGQAVVADGSPGVTYVGR